MVVAVRNILIEIDTTVVLVALLVALASLLIAIMEVVGAFAGIGVAFLAVGRLLIVSAATGLVMLVLVIIIVLVVVLRGIAPRFSTELRSFTHAFIILWRLIILVFMW